jgi:hypothetical protein
MAVPYLPRGPELLILHREIPIVKILRVVGATESMD